MKRSVRIAVIDDEEMSITSVSLNLRKFEKENSENFEISKYNEGHKFLKEFKNQYDIILLDILMPVINGLEVAQYIRKRDNKVILLFITAVDRYMSEGYALNIFNYIVKPIQYQKFSDTMKKALFRLAEAEKTSITVKNDEGLFKIYIGEIRYIETYERKLSIHRGTGHVICYKKMKEMEELLESYNFYRCHASFLVNMTYVREIIGNNVILITGEEIPISQNKRSGFLEAYSKYAGNII